MTNQYADSKNVTDANGGHAAAVWEGAGWYGLDGRYAAECTSDLVSGHPFERAVAESFLDREGVEGLADLLRLRADLVAFMDEEVDALVAEGVVEDDDGNPWFWWDDMAEFRIWAARVARLK